MYMTSMRLNRTMLSVKNMTSNFIRSNVLTIEAVLFKFIWVHIYPHEQALVHTLGSYETLTPTHNLMIYRHLLELWWKDVS